MPTLNRPKIVDTLYNIEIDPPAGRVRRRLREVQEDGDGDEGGTAQVGPQQHANIIPGSLGSKGLEGGFVGTMLLMLSTMVASGSGI